MIGWSHGDGIGEEDAPSVWYRPVVRLGGRTAAGAGQAIDCIWGISDCDAMMRSHDDGIAGETALNVWYPPVV